MPRTLPVSEEVWQNPPNNVLNFDYVQSEEQILLAQSETFYRINDILFKNLDSLLNLK